MKMQPLLKEVARGKRGARDLTYEESLVAARLIVDGEASPAQIGGFLVAERIKMESYEETSAFIQVLKDRAYHHPMAGGFDSAGPYDGRSKSFYATLPTAFVLAASGLPATLHSSPSMPPKWGITLLDVLAEMGIDAAAVPREAWCKAADETGFLFIPMEQWSDDLKKIRSIREELTLRTVFNTAEKLLRLSNAPFMAIGVFHGTVFEKMAAVLGKIGVERGIIIQGLEGSADIGLHKRTRTYIAQNGERELLIMDPEAYDMGMDMPEAEWTAQRQADTVLAVLEGRAERYFEQQVIFNSAVRLWVAQQVDSIEEGIYRVKKLLNGGKALQAYKTWSQRIFTLSSAPH